MRNVLLGGTEVVGVIYAVHNVTKDGFIKNITDPIIDAIDNYYTDKQKREHLIENN